ncbi:MAG: hypothetical protein ACLR8Y_14205 [Alistipes indistinctus]
MLRSFLQLDPQRNCHWGVLVYNMEDSDAARTTIREDYAECSGAGCRLYIR